MSWADAEFETLDPGDLRLNQRAISLIDGFNTKPDASILQACDDWTVLPPYFNDKPDVNRLNCWRADEVVHPGMALGILWRTASTAGDWFRNI